MLLASSILVVGFAAAALSVGLVVVLFVRRKRPPTLIPRPSHKGFASVPVESELVEAEEGDDEEEEIHVNGAMVLYDASAVEEAIPTRTMVLPGHHDKPVTFRDSNTASRRGTRESSDDDYEAFRRAGRL